MKILNKLFVLTFIPLMIFSTGGFNIFKHICHETGKIIISFQSPEDCEHEHELHKGHCNSISCDHLHINHHCCEDNHLFVRTIDNVNNEDDLPEIDYGILLDKNMTEIEFVVSEIKISEKYLYTDYVSPPEFTGKFTVIKHHSLKIDCSCAV